MENPNEEQNILQDADYSQKTDFSKGEVVRNQVQKCNDARSKEMKESYHNYDKMGNKVYIPDARREFVSAVKTLRIILSPEASRSERFLKAEAELKKQEEIIFNKWAIYPIITYGNGIKELTDGKKYIPELDQKIPKLYYQRHSGNIPTPILLPVVGLYNTNFHCYWNDIVDLYDKLYSELHNLADENDYFKKGTGF